MAIEDRTTKIIISNDMELAPKFEKIIYIENGKSICGTHEELLKNENYNKVYSMNLNKLGEEYV